MSPRDEELPSGSDDPFDDDFTTPPSRSAQTLTTVDLDSITPSASEISSEIKSAGFFTLTSPSIINDPER